MARHTDGPRLADSLRRYTRATRIVAGLALLVLFGAVAWDLADSASFWSRHPLVTSLVASLIVVVVTAAVVDEVIERRRRERWSLLAQFALVEFIHAARLVWSGLLELTDLVGDDELGNEALEAGSEAVRETPRLAAAMDEMLTIRDRREELHRLIASLLGRGQEVLGRWAGVLVSAGAYAEIVDRHVELYSHLYWFGIVFDESEPLEEHQSMPRLSRVSRVTHGGGPVEDAWLRDNLVAIAQLAESLDRGSHELALRIVPLDWWDAQLPHRPSRA